MRSAHSTHAPDAARPPIKVAVDARCLNNEHVRGMGKCLWELVSRTRDHDALTWHLFGDRPDLPFHRPGNDHVDAEVFGMRGYRFHAWEQIGLPRRVRRLRPQLLYCPAGSLPIWQPVPTVVTLHDAMPWVLDEPGWPPGTYRDRLQPAAFDRCAAMITVSEGSRRDIVRLWPALESKIHVVPNGVGEHYLSTSYDERRPVLERYGIAQPYLLYFGGVIPRKRLDWAVAVLEALNDPEIVLAVCGIATADQAALLERAPAGVRSRIQFLPFVPEQDMPQLYMYAAAVLYPTLYEGFGLPALEAQAVGSPVVFSDVNGLSELKGPGAVVVPADDVMAWRSAVRALVDHRRCSPRPDEAARRWAATFSWELYIDRTLRVWTDVLRRQAGRVALANAAG